MPWPKAVIFDLDGTLVDSAPTIAEAFNRILAQRGAPPVETDFVRGLVSRGVRKLVAACFGAYGTTVDGDLTEFRKVYGGITPSPDHLYPGTTAMLHRLSGEGMRLAVCTNKPQALTEGILAALGLARYFSCVIGGDACPRPKPHPDHLHDILARLGEKPENAVFVGDSEVDAEAAAAADVPFVLVTFGYALGNIEEIVHQARIDHFDGLPEELARIAATRNLVGRT